MLYIFLVDTGNMIQLDMNLALETVGYLKGVVARSCCIPPEKQVLLISGGESLEDDERVCKYAAGTDTNPIFLFSLVSIESPVPPEIATDFGTDVELNNKIETSLKLRDTQSTVAVRASLAQEVVKTSSEQTRICETLIHDQHLQHQGWAAVVANLEDTAIELQRRNEKFVSIFQTYLNQRERHRELIDVFDDDMALLHQIPVFPSLLKDESSSMVGSVIPNLPFEGESLTLLQWINSRGSSQSLEQLADSCYRSLQKMDHDLLKELRGNVGVAVDGCNNPQMKEIRGLGDRLSALEQLLIDAKLVVQEQGDLAKAFVHNQQRASGLNDASILPDLCDSHRQQLIVMRQNHQKVISIRSRCAKAKGELSTNLHHRMKWVVYVQNQMADVQQLLMLHSEELKRLEKRLQVMEQLHLAPSMYLATAVEVVRRRAFSRSFLQKSNCLADKFSQVHKEETSLRNCFQAKLKKHFLSKMFPGMDDLPPEFATNHPDLFDDRLPDITLADVDTLRKAFPDLAKSLSLPDEGALEQLLARSLHQTLTAEEGEALYSLQSLPQKIHIHGGDIASVSVINKLIAGENFSKKKFSRLEKLSDSETDTETGRTTRRRQARKKSSDKLTRSLPLDGSLDGDDLNKSAGFSVEAAQEEPSSSSAAPSSSSGVNTANCSSVAPSSSSDGSVMKQGSQHWPPASDDKSGLIASLTTKINDTESRVSKLQEDIRNCAIPTRDSLIQFKEELLAMKEQIYIERDHYLDLIKTISENLVSGVEVVHQGFVCENESALSEVETRLQEKHCIEVEKLQERLELELKKVEACQADLEGCRHEVERQSELFSQLQGELNQERLHFKKEKGQLEIQKEDEKETAIRALTLEHELELDALRHKLEHTERVQKNETETAKLREELMMKENDLEALRRKMRLLEAAEKDRFKSEKEKIVQILEAGFVQREKLSVQTNLDAAETRHKDELTKLEKRLQEKLKQQLENSREKIRSDWEKKLTDLRTKMKTEIEEIKREQTQLSEAALEQLKQKMTEEREVAMKAQADKLNAKAKRELDGLRQRFRIMQTTGALDRSPSVSESELSIESPRSPDVVENIRSALVAEFETNLRSERSKFQLQLQQVRDEHQQQLMELASKGKLRSTAEQQVMFNEVLKKAMDEKNAKIEELSKANKAHEEVVASLRNQMKNGDHSDGASKTSNDNHNAEREKLRGTAEQQIMFNEALKKAMDEKNAKLEELAKANKSQEELIESLRQQLSLKQPSQNGDSSNETIEAAQKALEEKSIEIDELTKAFKAQESVIEGLQNEVKNAERCSQNGGDVVERLAELARQNARLEMELRETKSNLDKAMATSVMCLPPSVDVNSHQDMARLQQENQLLKEQLSKSMLNLIKNGRVSVTTVDKGDNVMIVWNEDHANYMIYTETSTLFHFLHSDSLAILGLSPTNVPRKQYVTAEVVDKEYCQARKSENRFRVPQGTKFYRIKCKPLAKDISAPKTSPTLTNGNGTD